jgi:hypothetical protein
LLLDSSSVRAESGGLESREGGSCVDSHALARLPFYLYDTGKVKLWGPTVEDGVGAADAAVDFMLEHGNPLLLGQIHRAQAEMGRYGPTEQAFWRRVAERLR